MAALMAMQCLLYLKPYTFFLGQLYKKYILKQNKTIAGRWRQTVQPPRYTAMQQAVIKRLTPRESEVFHYLLGGKANKVIAMELGISMRTVETHRARIFHKVGVRNAIELVICFYAPDLWANESMASGSNPAVNANPGESGTSGNVNTR